MLVYSRRKIPAFPCTYKWQYLDNTEPIRRSHIKAAASDRPGYCDVSA